MYNVTVDGSQSNLNVTDLPSGVMYTLQVVAVADGQMSFPSVAVTAMTFFPCKWCLVHVTALYTTDSRLHICSKSNSFPSYVCFDMQENLYIRICVQLVCS